jgi:hypothetical protein
MTPEEAQQLMQEATGFTPDAAVKDVARCIYMVPEDHTKYVSLKLFEVSISSPKLGEARRGLNEGTSEAGPVAENEAVQTTPTPPNLGGENKCFKGIPYTSIISEWWRRNGGEPAEGERNVNRVSSLMYPSLCHANFVTY